jgi:hypothetical protein
MLHRAGLSPRLRAWRARRPDRRRLQQGLGRRALAPCTSRLACSPCPDCPSHPTAAPATPMPRQPRPSRAAAALSRLTLALTRAYSCVRAPAAQDAATPLTLLHPLRCYTPLCCYTPLTLLHPPYAATPAYAATPPYAAQDAPWYDCATGRLLPKPLVERAYTTVAAAKALIDVTPVAKLRQVLLMRPSRARNPNPNPGPAPNPNPNPSQYQP